MASLILIGCHPFEDSSDYPFPHDFPFNSELDARSADSRVEPDAGRPPDGIGVDMVGPPRDLHTDSDAIDQIGGEDGAVSDVGPDTSRDGGGVDGTKPRDILFPGDMLDEGSMQFDTSRDTDVFVQRDMDTNDWTSAGDDTSTGVDTDLDMSTDTDTYDASDTDMDTYDAMDAETTPVTMEL